MRDFKDTPGWNDFVLGTGFQLNKYNAPLMLSQDGVRVFDSGHSVTCVSVQVSHSSAMNLY